MSTLSRLNTCLAVMALLLAVVVAPAGAATTTLLAESFDNGFGVFSAQGYASTDNGVAVLRGGSADGTITSGAVPAAGQTNLTLSWTQTTSRLDAGESLVVEWSTGSSWSSLSSERSSGVLSVGLPTAAASNALQLRFRVDASSYYERVDVDDVVLTAGDGGGSGNPYAKGPDPTWNSIEATTGPFEVDDYDISSFAADGFGGADVYYPSDAGSATFGGIAISPGYTASRSTVTWLGPRIASQGFVVIVIDTNSRYDQPASRGDQLLAALDQLVNDSDVSHLVDPNRLAVMGHSMGGGGSLEAADDRPSLRAIVPLQGWNSDKTWSQVQVPALLIGGENDSVAPDSSHSQRFYDSLGGEKVYLQLNNASHFASNSPNTTIASYSIAWLKRWVDEDTRYSQFVCGPDAGQGSAISDYRTTCPV